MIDPREMARRAAALTWQQRQGAQLDIGDHNALQHYTNRLSEQLGVPVMEIRRDLAAAASQADTSWKAHQLFTGLVFGP